MNKSSSIVKALAVWISRRSEKTQPPCVWRTEGGTDTDELRNKILYPLSPTNSGDCIITVFLYSLLTLTDKLRQIVIVIVIVIVMKLSLLYVY